MQELSNLQESAPTVSFCVLNTDLESRRTIEGA